MKKNKFIILISIFLILFVFSCTLSKHQNPSYETETNFDENITDHNELNYDNYQVDNSIFKDIGDYYAFGGDILFDKSDQEAMLIVKAFSTDSDEQLEKMKSSYVSNYDNQSAMQKGVKLRRTLKWKYGKIPYTLDPSFDSSFRSSIKKAMDKLESVCEVDFYEYKKGMLTFGNPIYNIVEGNLGYSYSTLGAQSKAKCLLSWYGYDHVLHEFCHGLGIHHEHQRYDRNSNIDINWENIEEDFKSQFQIIPKKQTYWIILPFITYEKTNSYVYGAYDYMSIMHYTEYAFSKNGKKTIETFGNPVRGRDLSATDIYTLQQIYPSGTFGPYNNSEYYNEDNDPYSNPYGSSPLLSNRLSDSFAIQEF